MTRLSTLDSLSLNINSTDLIVTDLVPYSEYEVMVAALTGEGSGPYTNPLVLQTKQDGKQYLVLAYTSDFIELGLSC